jgi:hypothetical protein
MWSQSASLKTEATELPPSSVLVWPDITISRRRRVRLRYRGVGTQQCPPRSILMKHLFFIDHCTYICLLYTCHITCKERKFYEKAIQ